MTSSPSADARPSRPRGFPPLLLALSAGLGLLLWGVAATRHGLLQSNAYDLGLFDQWAWLIGSGAAPISSMEQVHVLADHGAWMLYMAGPMVGQHMHLLHRGDRCGSGADQPGPLIEQTQVVSIALEQTMACGRDAPEQQP